ncbi:MAG: hypothetical protein CMJ94_14865 [Planctomycetes bacterium]|nr:hypothetical protein [Planctomycetota bacterium]
MSAKIPGHWLAAPLSLALEFDLTDGDWVESKDQDPNGGVRLTQLADVGVGRFRDRSDRHLTTQKAEELRCTMLEPNDVLIARLPDPLGRACLFPGDTKPCVTVVDVAIARSRSNAIVPQFLVMAMNSPMMREIVETFATGTTRKRISTGNLRKTCIPLPPLAEQHRIVAKVDELMGHVAVVEERHLAATSARVRFRDAALHALAEAEDHEAVEAAWSRIEDHFDDLFTEPEDIQPLRQTILQLAVRGRLVAQEAGDEAVRPIQDLCKSISTSGHKVKTSQIEKSGPVPVVDQGQGLIAGYTSRRDLAITVDAPMLVFGDHTRAIKFIDFDFVAGADGTKILRPVGVDARYLYVSIQAADLESRGYGRHFKILKATEIRVPPLAEQHRVVAKVDELMALCDTLEVSLTRAKTTREQFASSISHALTGPTAASA